MCKNEKITPKKDVIFKRLFGSVGSEKILKSLLEAILEIKIESVELNLDKELEKAFAHGLKMAGFDIDFIGIDELADKIENFKGQVKEEVTKEYPDKFGKDFEKELKERLKVKSGAEVASTMEEQEE